MFVVSNCCILYVVLTVDSQLNAKIADLELGSSALRLDFATTRASLVQRDSEVGRASESEFDGDIVIVEDLLANWLAPEVITGLFDRNPVQYKVTLN